MNPKPNAPAAAHEEHKSGCCCGSSSDTAKNTAAESGKTTASVKPETADKEAGGQSHGCCGGH